jgi:hypothetical protein
MNKQFRQIITKKYLEYILLSVIVILGFIVRLYRINNPLADWHSWRQVDTASVTRTYLEKGINILVPKYHDISSIQSRIFNPEGYRFVEFPVYNVLHAVLVKYIPVFSLEVWGRLLSIFSASISTVLLFLIGRKFLGKAGGLLAAAFFAFLPYNIYFTRVILPEPMATMFALFGLWVFAKYTESFKGLYFYSSAVSLALALLIKPFTIFYLVPISFLAITSQGGIKKLLTTKDLLFKHLTYLAIAFIPFILWRIWMRNFPEGIPLFEWAFNGDRIRFRPSFWRWIFGERLGKLILGTWGLIPFVIGVLVKEKKNSFILFFLLGMFFYVLVFASANVKHDYYQTFIIPAVALTLASGALALWKGLGMHKYLSRITLLFSVFIMLMLGWLGVKDNFSIIHPEILQAGAAVDRLTPKDALIIAPYNGDTAFLYQTKRWGWPAVDDSIDNIIKKGADYYATVNLDDADTKMIVGRFKVIERTDQYLIADLHQELNSK